MNDENCKTDIHIFANFPNNVVLIVYEKCVSSMGWCKKWSQQIRSFRCNLSWYDDGDKF